MQEQEIIDKIRALVNEMPAITGEEIDIKQMILSLLTELEKRICSKKQWEVWT